MLFDKKRHQMDLKQADATLQNVFKACHIPPNTVAFDRLAFRRKLNTRIYNRLLAITALLLLFTFVLPLIVVPAASFLNGSETSEVMLISDTLSGDVLKLTLSGSGICYSEAYQETDSGIIEPALSYNEKTGVISFSYYGTETNIYIPLENAPDFHLWLSPR
ncbi:MAG: hypothetical protein K2I22_10355 [Lachnospiraceae bacterium]|nr:hypothetical protein [Lachnospiraceae bacterium]